MLKIKNNVLTVFINEEFNLSWNIVNMILLKKLFKHGDIIFTITDSFNHILNTEISSVTQIVFTTQAI